MAAQLEEHQLVMLGAGGVGKSALTIRLVNDDFVEQWDPTIEDTYLKQLVIDEKAVSLEIMDTAGQENFESMRDAWMRDGDGFMMLYSIIDRSTFEEMKNFHTSLTRVKNNDNPAMVLVGNKCDLSDDRQVSLEEGEALAAQWGCSFYETSAKTKLNSEVCFFDLVRKIREQSADAAGAKKSAPRKHRKCIIL